MAGEKVRVAFIGAGSMANTVHYPSLAGFNDVEIAAVCDINTERLHRTADKYGIEKRYTDYRKAIEETDPDGVYVVGQPHLMYDIWVWCLESGLNLYIEKPMGITLHQARSLAYLAEQNNCITQVSFQRRSTPMVSMLRDKCLERGPITHAVCEFYKCEMKPDTSARGHMMDDSVHAIDTLRWMCGGEVVEIESVTRRVRVPDINFIAALLYFDNGSTGVLLNSWSSGRRVFRVEMHAPEIAVDAEHERKGYLYADGDINGVEYDSRVVARSDEFHVYAGFQAKNREFIDALITGTPTGSPFCDAVKTMEVADKILAMGTLIE